MQPYQHFPTLPWQTSFLFNTQSNQWQNAPIFPLYFDPSLGQSHLTNALQNPCIFPSNSQINSALMCQNTPINETPTDKNCTSSQNNNKSGVNFPTSDVISSLKEWVIVDFEDGGTFRIAGHRSDSGQLLLSGKIVFVNNNGNIISDGQQTFLLYGPIAWKLYEVQFPGIKVNPTAELKQAFSDGFPKNDRKQWISKLYKFLEGLSCNAVSSGNTVNRNPIETSSPALSPPSLIKLKSNDGFPRNSALDLPCVDEYETIPSVTMLEEDQYDDSSDVSETFRPKICRQHQLVKRRKRPKCVDVGVQTISLRSPERPKMISRSTSTEVERGNSPISAWMRSGCRVNNLRTYVY